MNADMHTIESILPVAKLAGKAILDIYYAANDMRVSLKDDKTPVTDADRAANAIIVAELGKLFPEVPILSEEEKNAPYAIRKNWERYWCVDPLDGTKEFIHKRDEFTVNIALIHAHTPVLGVIYLPVADTMYYGGKGCGSWRTTGGQAPEKIAVARQADNWTAIGSRSHAGDNEKALLAKYPVTRMIAAGSSLKFCRIAEGAAQIYYREGPTMEWDTAAGHAIAVASGATMTSGDGAPFTYNKPSLLNGSFLCMAGEV